MIDIDVHSTSKGPLTDGRALRAHDEYVQDVSRVVANQGARLVVSFLKGSIKDPTPRYWYSIHAEPFGSGWEVVDNNAVYGPWLEGTGSRNRARPGFPGYHSFRRASQMLDRQAWMVAERHLALFIPRMN